MELVYRSTRNAQETATASMAILKGLANEGGLFVPCKGKPDTFVYSLK